MRAAEGRGFREDFDTQSEKRTTARFMTQSGSTSSREGDIFDQSMCSTEVRSCLNNLSYIVRKRLSMHFSAIYVFALDDKQYLARRLNRNRQFSQLQLTCCSSIFEIVALRAQKQMIRAFLTVKQSTGLGSYCQLDVMRRVRLLASKNPSGDSSSNGHQARHPPTFPNAIKTGRHNSSYNMNELLLERAGMLLQPILALQRKRVGACFAQIRSEAQRILIDRSTRKFARRRMQIRRKSRSTSRNNSIINKASDDYNDETAECAEDAPPKPNRITKHFNQYQTDRNSLSQTQLLMDSNRSTSRGRNILTKMESIISELNQEIRQRSRSKSPLNSTRNSYQPQERPSERTIERSRSPINYQSERFKIKIPLSGVTTCESASSTFRSNNDDPLDSNSLLCKEDLNDAPYELPKQPKEYPRNNPQEEFHRSKGFLRNTKIDKYKSNNSNSFNGGITNQMQTKEVSYPQQAVQPQIYDQFTSETFHYQGRGEHSHQYLPRMETRQMNYQQPIYPQFPQSHYYPPPVYPYYPPGMVPNSQYFCPPQLQPMPYYMHQMQAMAMQNGGSLGMGMPPQVINPNLPQGMHPKQHPKQNNAYTPDHLYPNFHENNFGGSHNSSAEEISGMKEHRTRNSHALLGEINNSFGEQSFSGQQFAQGQCKFHKVCSCFSSE